MSDSILPITLGLLSFSSALIALILTNIELRDKRKRITGLRVKVFKQGIAFCSFFLAIITVMLQTRKEINSGIEIANRNHVEDSLAINRFDTSLGYINRTLKLQKITLDSVTQIMDKQRSELNNSIKILNKEEIALNKYALILQTEGTLSDSLNVSIDLINKNLLKQNKVFRQTQRILTPLKDVFFSYRFEYYDADKEFPKYYKKMDSIHKLPKEVRPDYGIIYQSEGTAIKIPNYSDFLPKETRLETSNAHIKFYTLKDSLGRKSSFSPDLEFDTWGWFNIFKDRFINNDEKYYGNLTTPRLGTDYHIIIDFKKKTLEKYVHFSSYNIKLNNYSILSASDLLYPENPENKFIEVTYLDMSGHKNSKARLTWFNISFGQNDQYSIDIPPEEFSIDNKYLNPVYFCSITKIQNYLKNRGYHNIPVKATL